MAVSVMAGLMWIWNSRLIIFSWSPPNYTCATTKRINYNRLIIFYHQSWCTSSHPQIVVIAEYSRARCRNSCILSAARWSWQPQDGKHFSGTQIMRKSRRFHQSETGTLLKLSCQVKQKMQIWCARNMKDSECNKSTWFEATELKWQSGGASGNPEVLVEWL